VSCADLFKIGDKYMLLCISWPAPVCCTSHYERISHLIFLS
jgi:hypothetical protein